MDWPYSGHGSAKRPRRAVMGFAFAEPILRADWRAGHGSTDHPHRRRADHGSGAGQRQDPNRAVGPMWLMSGPGKARGPLPPITASDPIAEASGRAIISSGSAGSSRPTPSAAMRPWHDQPQSDPPRARIGRRLPPLIHAACRAHPDASFAMCSKRPSRRSPRQPRHCS